MYELRCNGCLKPPNQIEEYIHAAENAGCTPEEFVIEEDGTYNIKNGHFYCTECYILAGCPGSTAEEARWVAP